jgi:nucleoside-diphosphate-sugar epimerase
VTSVVVTGSAGRIGRRVVRLLERQPGVDQVIGLDSVQIGPAGDRAARRRLDIEHGGTELVEALRRADVLVHLARTTGDPDDEVARARNRRTLDSALTAAAEAGVSHVVVISSALVYGAWANNAVPLAEVTPLRPNPGFSYGVDAAELERVVGEWADLNGRGLTVLRPAPAVGERSSSWIGRAMQAAARVRVGSADPPVQFLHVDDLAAAVAVAVERRLDGAFNVAPDGWISGDGLRALQAARPRFWFPEPVAERISALRSRRARRPMPAGLLPYTMHPCVVANDRLRAEGWVPQLTNEEAFVAADEPPPWASMNAHQRQVVSLVITGVLLVAAVTGLVFLVRWLRGRAARAAALFSVGELPERIEE